jgi:ketosteroid isomerase-like protein
MVAEPGRVINGQAQIRDAYEQVFMAGKGQLAIMPRQVLVLEGDVALLYDSWQITGTNPDGSPMSASGSSVMLLRRQSDGNWLYVVDDPFTQVYSTFQAARRRWRFADPGAGRNWFPAAGRLRSQSTGRTAAGWDPLGASRHVGRELRIDDEADGRTAAART